MSTVFFGREITEYTVICHTRSIYTVLANPTNGTIAFQLQKIVQGDVDTLGNEDWDYSRLHLEPEARRCSRN